MSSVQTQATSTSSATSHFIQMVKSSERLTRNQEQELLARYYERGDRIALERLVRAHLRYVVTIALKYKRYGLPLGDLIAEGNFGIVHALGKFEPARGNRFVTYAVYWVRAYILNHVIRSWSLVGVGSGALRSKMFFKLRRERARLLNQLGDENLADELLAKRMNITQKKLSSMLGRLEGRDVSLDAKLFGDTDTSLVDRLIEPGASQEAIAIAHELRVQQHEAVRQAVQRLDDRERYIVSRRLMADPEEELSLAEIGRKLGVSRERVRQLEARAVRKLRHELRALSPGNDTALPSAAA